MTINVFTTDTVRRRRIGVLATAGIALALLGAGVANTSAQHAAAAPPDYCNGERKTDQVTPGVRFDGTWRDEVIVGTNQSDEIHGGGGRDIICGLGLDDDIYGGENVDWMSGGSGVDRLWGYDSADILFGNEDGDELYGMDGDDTLRSGDGIDLLSGGLNDDVLHCGLDADSANGGPEDDGDWLVSDTNHGCEVADDVEFPEFP